MTRNVASPKGPAQQALARMLDMLLPDAEVREKAVADALRSARREKLPEDPWELLRFVKADLAPQLKKSVPGSFVLALVDDLASEMDRRPREDARESPTGARRRSLAKMDPAARAPPSKVGRALKASMPRMQRAVKVAGLTLAARPAPRAVSKKPRSAPPTSRASSRPEVEPADDSGPAVVLVDADRLTRATLARELLKAQFDVSAFDAIPEATSALLARRGVVVAILDARQMDIEPLEKLVEALPTLRVIVRTDAASRFARSVLTAAGVQSFITVPRAAAVAEVIATARKIIASPPSTEPVSKTSADLPPTVRGGPRSRR